MLRNLRAIAHHHRRSRHLVPLTRFGAPDLVRSGWGWKLIRESLCPLAEFDRHLATILQSTEIAEAKLEAADQFELFYNGDGKKTHRCLQCKKCVIGRGDFNKHYRTHTNHKPYMCRAKTASDS